MSESKSSGGIGICGLLGVAFVILKLCKVIDWSWWWVTLPFWGGIGLVLIVLVIIGLIALIGAKRSEEREKQAPRSSWKTRLEEIQARERQRRGYGR